MNRRDLIALSASVAAALTLKGQTAQAFTTFVGGQTPLGSDLNPDALPVPDSPAGFLADNEKRLVGAIFDRLIPADELSIGATEAGCVEFLDRQLAGDFGAAASVYRLGPFEQGTPEQGPQFQATPAERYRAGLAAIDSHCHDQFKKSFAELSADQQDELLGALEAGRLALPGIDGPALFGLMLQNVREGYFADPLYGGNKDMAGWKLVGFPGARYEFRDAIQHRGEDLKIEPVSMLGRL